MYRKFPISRKFATTCASFKKKKGARRRVKRNEINKRIVRLTEAVQEGQKSARFQSRAIRAASYAGRQRGLTYPDGVNKTNVDLRQRDLKGGETVAILPLLLTVLENP